MRKLIKMWTNTSHTLADYQSFATTLNNFIGNSSQGVMNHCELIGFGETGYALVGTEYTNAKLKEFEDAIVKAQGYQSTNGQI